MPKSTTPKSTKKLPLYKRGIINGIEYIVIGIKKKEDDSGYFLEFIDRDPNNPDGKTVGRIFIPTPMAKTLGRGLLDQMRDEEII